jgi:hypothetical protein
MRAERVRGFDAEHVPRACCHAAGELRPTIALREMF